MFVGGLETSRGTEYLSQDSVDIELANFLELRSGAKIGWLWVVGGMLVEGWFPRLPNTLFLEVFGSQKHTDRTPNLRR